MKLLYFQVITRQMISIWLCGTQGQAMRIVAFNEMMSKLAAQIPSVFTFMCPFLRIV